MTKVVPKLLTSGQKQKCLEICGYILKQVEENPKFVASVITCDETWIFQYDYETKKHSTYWKTANLHELRERDKSKFKAMLIFVLMLRVLS